MHVIHRGIVNKKFKENLLSSFKKSFYSGFGIETDIHATKDQQFICFHDFTFNRMFEKNLSIKNLNYANIKKISSLKKSPISTNIPKILIVNFLLGNIFELSIKRSFIFFTIS